MNKSYHLSNNIESALQDLFDVIEDSLTQDKSITIKHKRYDFSYTFDENVQKQQAKDKLKIAHIILSKYVNAIAKSIYEKSKGNDDIYLSDCRTIINSLVPNCPESIDGQLDKSPVGKITYLMPENRKANQCFEFNHLSDEEQQKVIAGLQREGRTVLAFPCTKKECFAPEEQDEEIEWFLKKIEDEERARSDEYEAALMTALESGKSVSEFMQEYFSKDRK